VGADRSIAVRRAIDAMREHRINLHILLLGHGRGNFEVIVWHVVLLQAHQFSGAEVDVKEF